jgi:hypothetical protein
MNEFQNTTRFFARAKIHIISLFRILFYKIKRFLQIGIEQKSTYNRPTGTNNAEFNGQTRP